VNIKLRRRRALMAAMAGTALFGFGSNAMADSTFDLVEALVQKGILTEEEALPLLKSRANEEKAQTKKMEKAMDDKFPVKTSYGSKGFRLESNDGNFQTNLAWRAQLRFTTPDNGDPRQLGNFNDNSQNTFEGRRLRMKIGGHAYRPWLKYYFEVDLQPTREFDDGSANASSRVIDWRADIAKFDYATLRLGQWKINYNRERVDSSGKQQFVERSIVNRVFTIDRQVGAQLTGRLFKETPIDMNYWAGVYTGEGRGVENDDNNLMTMARLQWNPFGRELKWQQTDVDFTEKPTASISLATASNTGRCTRWSSSGCGNLDGFSSPAAAANGQFDVDQWTQGSAFKYRGFSWQQEYHRKEVDDNVNNTSSELTGGYMQAGYFFGNLIPLIPKNLEFAARYAYVKEPNRTDINEENKRKEYTVAANLFLFGAKHNNKITADFSHLTLDDGLVNQSESEDRFRLQWDVTF
jgi:phosphate-selective porin OprO and OprP